MHYGNSTWLVIPDVFIIIKNSSGAFTPYGVYGSIVITVCVSSEILSAHRFTKPASALITHIDKIVREKNYIGAIPALL